MESVAAGASVAGYHSVESSPRSRAGDSWDDPATSARFRVMCSYGGQILPRLADKSLCYIGGETRMVSIDRYASLAHLSAKLSRDLVGGATFALKYQLPNEDLDSLISVSTDEDLENMIDELDRISASPASSSSGGGSTRSARLRVFLFPSKPDSAPIGPPIDGSKSETWFVDSLNNATGGLGVDDIPRLLALDDEDSSINSLRRSDGDRDGRQLEPERPVLPRPDSFGKIRRHGQESQSVPNSPMLDKASSFGSTSSAPSLSNLPPIPIPTIDHIADRRLDPLPVAISSSLMRTSDGNNSDLGGFRNPKQPPNATQSNTITSDPASRSIHSMQNSDPKIPSDQVVYVIPAIQPEQQSNLHLHQQQLQFIPANPHYLHQPAPGSVLPVPSYYPIAGHSLQQMPQARPLNHPIPVFYVPVHHTSPYNWAPVQPDLNDPSSSPSSATLSAAPSSSQPQLIHVAANQSPHPYGGAGFHVMQHPHLSQPPATMANYPYQQMHYSQATSQPVLLRQHQGVGSASLVPEVAATPGDGSASGAP
ncbi:uncharacterized protein LOC121976648 [Zingiber officinale]|uniref:PB1 domain-containing protein n=1 Tax=Zingiber officinale TaxID=94328 RepID=A0A8J5GYA6_ZINOF|nr:uncharacterized protein LOC121976648 [Zingiber officinale]KAG6512386.1 hypothetical protein ZIOFF_030497 [Zingiber officinale]